MNWLRRASSEPRWQEEFSDLKITTKVYMMAPAEREAIALDVVDYMWEEKHELAATREQRTAVARRIFRSEDHDQGLHDGSRGTRSHRFGRCGLYVGGKT